METLYGSFQKRKGTILMSGFEHKTEIAEAERSIQKSEAFREIKPEKEISFEEVQAFWDNFLTAISKRAKNFVMTTVRSIALTVNSSLTRLTS